MNKAINTIARAVDAGALKTSASTYIQSETPMPPYDPEKANSVLSLTFLVGDKDNIESWTEEDWGIVKVTGSGEFAGKEDFNEDIYVNNGKKVVLTAEENTGYEFMGFYTADGPELITNSKTLILQTPDEGAAAILALAKKI